MREGGEPEAAEGDPLHGLVRRMEDALVHPPATLVEGAQGRRILVRLGRQLVQLAARHLAHRGEVRARALEGGGVHHQLAEELEVPVLEVEVEAARGRHRVLGGWRRWAGEAHRAEPAGRGVPSLPSHGNPRWARAVGAMFTWETGGAPSAPERYAGALPERSGRRVLRPRPR